MARSILILIKQITVGSKIENMFDNYNNPIPTYKFWPRSNSSIKHTYIYLSVIFGVLMTFYIKLLLTKTKILFEIISNPS